MNDVTSQIGPPSWDQSDSPPQADNRSTPEDGDLMAVKGRILLDPAIRQLNRGDRDILRSLLFEGRTRADVSAALEIERAELSLLLRRILDDLRHAADGISA